MYAIVYKNKYLTSSQIDKFYTNSKQNPVG